MGEEKQVLATRARVCIIGCTLLALFLGALDALVMSAAMPSIVADLGGLHLFSWVYSAYLLARAISLPIFGKLADLFHARGLFLFTIFLFLLASIAAGLAQNMAFLIVARTLQGIAAGGIFALVYIVLSDVAQPGQRARTLSLASSIWGISSVIGPSLGGFIVTFFSWRWIFLLNVPLGIFCIFGLGAFLKKSRPKKKHVSLDFAGVTFLTGSVLGLLTIFITAGQEYAWNSKEIVLLGIFTSVCAVCFYFAEKRAKDPLVDLDFFKNKGFTLGNSATFFSSFSIFALFGYAPLFIQGGLGKSPLQVGIAMLSLSLGWSFGSLFLGRFVPNAGGRKGAISGALLLLFGSCLTLGFTIETSLAWCSLAFFPIGLGMGCVSLSTMLLVQDCLQEENLGIATSFHQFSRSLGGTIGVGFCGGIVTTGLMNRLQESAVSLPTELVIQLQESTANLFNPEFQGRLEEGIRIVLQKGVASGLSTVFWLVVVSSLLCLLSCLFLPTHKQSNTSFPKKK